MNPFQRLGVKISNWWKGEPQDSGGIRTLNSPSFLERLGLKRKGKPTSEVTYFTCLKMLSETLAKMPIKYYQKTEKGIVEAEATDASKLLSKRPNPFAAFIFTVVMIVVFLRVGSEPSTLIENVFRFLSVEGGAMALIKSVKTVKGKSNGESNIHHMNEPEQGEEE